MDTVNPDRTSTGCLASHDVSNIATLHDNGFSRLPIDPNFVSNILKGVVTDEDAIALQHRAYGDSTLQAEYALHCKNIFHQATANYNSRFKYSCRYVTDPDHISKLQRHNPWFTVCTGADTEAVQHPYARESRMLEHLFIYNHVIKYNNTTVLSPEYDVLVKDVGGNPIIHDVHNRKLVHTCNPVLSSKDHLRHATWIDYIQQHAVDSNVMSDKYPIVKDHFGRKRLCCANLSQHCEMKAPIVTFIHSTYDMSYFEIGDTLDKSNCLRAYVVFIFSPEMLIDSSGRLDDYSLNWRKFNLYGKTYITFEFDTDASTCYTHEWSKYTAMVQNVYFITPSGSVYAVEREYRNATIFLTLVKTVHPVNPELVISRLPFPDSTDSRLFGGYFFTNNYTEYDNMKPIVLKMSDQFFRQVVFYAMGLTGTKFTVDSVKQYIISANSTVTVGTHTSKGPNYSPEFVAKLSACVYVYVYRMNYDSSKSVQKMIADTNEYRALNDHNVFIRMMLRMWYRKQGRVCHPTLPNSGEYTVDNYTSLENELFPRDDLNAVLQPSFFQRLEQYFPDFVMRYPLVVTGPRIMKYAEAVEMGVTVTPTPTYSHALPISPEGYLSSDNVMAFNKIQEFLKNDPTASLIISVIKSRSNSQNPIRAVPEFYHGRTLCDDHLVVDQVSPGDGNCFYHCLSSFLNFPSTVTPDHIRSRLLQSKYLPILASTVENNVLSCSMEAYRQIVERLQPLRSRDDIVRWADESVVLLAALEYRIHICVHDRKATHCKVFNTLSTSVSADNKPLTMHIDHSGNHFNLLVDDISKVRMYESYDLDLSSTDMYDYELYSEEEFHDIMAPVLVDEKSDESARVVKRTIKKYREYAMKYSPFSTLAKYDYKSYYGPMLGCVLKEITNDQSIQTRQLSILDVDPRNKSSLQFLSRNPFFHQSPQITSLSLATRDNDLSNIPASAVCKYVWRLSDVPSENFKRLDKVLSGEKFDLVTINPAFYSDELTLVNESSHLNHVTRLLPLVRNVKTSGTLVMSLLLPVGLESASIIFSLSKYFRGLKIIQPTIMPQHLPWAFAVFVGRNLVSAEATELDAARTHTSFTSSLCSYLPSINDDFLSSLSNEIGTITLRNYRAPSQRWVTKMSEFFRRIPDTPINVGYLPFDLPSFTPTEAPSTYPVLSTQMLKDLLPGHLPVITRSNRLSVTLYYSALIRDTFLDLHRDRIRLPTLRNDLCSFIHEYLDGPPEKLDDVLFCVKYAIAYLYEFDKVTQDTPGYPIIPVHTKQLSKPIESDLFYKSGCSGFFKKIILSIPLWAENEYSSVSGVEYVTTGNIFSPDRHLPTVVNVAFDPSDVHVEESSDLDDSCNFVSVVESTDNVPSADPKTNWFESPSSRKEYWLDGSYTSDARASGIQYYKEYLDSLVTMINTTKAYAEGIANSVLAELPSIARPFMTNAKHILQCESHLKAYVAPAEVTNVLFIRDGRRLLGSGVKEFGNRRYVLAYDVVDNVVTNSRFYRTENPNGQRASYPKNCIGLPELDVLMDLDIHNHLRNLSVDTVVPDIAAIQAGPGCGKTHTALQLLVDCYARPDAGDKYLIVLKNGANVEAARKKFQSMYDKLRLGTNSPKSRDISLSCITSIDVLLSGKFVNNSFTRLLIDEAMTHHPGKVVASCVLTGLPATIFGDVAQIGYICRLNGFIPQYPSTAHAFPIVGMLFKSFRVTADVCYELSPRYAAIAECLGIPVTDPHFVMTTLNEAATPSMTVLPIDSVDNIPVDPDTQYLTFLQQDKQVLEKYLGNKIKNSVMTVHEYQGNENRRVAIIRLSKIKDTQFGLDDGVFGSDQHIVSAISRHTSSCKYYTASTSDKLSQVITKLNLDYARIRRV